MDKLFFEELVKRKVNSMHEDFKKEIDNVIFFVEDVPSPEQIRKLNLRKNHTLFGLYEGVPLSKRGTNYHSVLPDRITIFRIPILQSSRTIEDVINQVNDTVWHEIAHYFGMNEAEVRKAEFDRKQNRSREKNNTI